MKILMVVSSLCMISLSANDRLNQLKSSIIRSDDKVVEMQLSKGYLSSSAVCELVVWSKDCAVYLKK
jgi:hypothetical protein